MKTTYPLLVSVLLWSAFSTSCAGIPMNKSDAIKTCERDAKAGEIFLYEAQDRAVLEALEEGDVYKARVIVETQRRALYVSCQQNIRDTKRYRDLLASFKSAEEIVKDLEDVRGVTFQGEMAERDLTEDNIDLEWKDSDGRTLTDEAGQKL